MKKLTKIAGWTLVTFIARKLFNKRFDDSWYEGVERSAGICPHSERDETYYTIPEETSS